MKVAIIGAGVVGVTTAYMLAKAGHDVSVFEREPGIAMESSYANGGQLSYGFASPMGNPQLLAKVPSILFGADPAFRMPTLMSPDFVTWSLKFLGQCLPGATRRNAQALSELAQESGKIFTAIRTETDIDFGHRSAGKIVMLKSAKALRRAQSATPQQNGKRVLSWDECLDLEPALGKFGHTYAGGVWVPGDEVGDAAQFSEGLASIATSKFGVRFYFNRDVSRISTSDRHAAEVVLASGETFASDAVIMCTGVAGRSILKQNGINLPIFPVMGYSITAPLGTAVPDIAITDAEHKVVFSRIGDQIRVAGFADFGTASEERRRQRVQELIAVARQLVPEMADFSSIRSTWIGARPATPNSLPIVGETKIPGLYLNMGHGMFGWTLSAVAASKIVNLIGPAETVSRAA